MASRTSGHASSRTRTAPLTSPVAAPVIKWVGGKTRLLPELTQRLPATFGRYFEPFAGGAALFFRVAPPRAVLSDFNPDLVGLYTTVRRDVAGVIKQLERHRTLHSEAHYYDVRTRWNDREIEWSTAERAATFIYLNKTCFNGLWRVNSSGRFNVPFGKYVTPKILDADVLRAAHEALSFATIRLADFSVVTSELRAGDFAYFDPPYVPVSKTSNFTAYASDRFGPAEQERLATELARLKRRGVKAMLSNAATKESIALYERHGFVVDSIRAARAINSDPKKRGDVDELVVTTYRAMQKAARSAARRRAVV